MIENRKRTKGKLLLLCIAGMLFLGACRSKNQAEEARTPKACVEYAMERLKELDLEAFNQYSDNYIGTYRNWLGIPREREYRIFGELQPGVKKGKRYRAKYELAQKIVEQMSWEIGEIREDGTYAQIELTITNKDMKNVGGELEIRMLKNMTESVEGGIGGMFREAVNMANAEEELLSIIDNLKEDEICTTEVTLLAYQEKGRWKIHVSEELVNGVMGNMMSETYSEDVENRIKEQMEQYEEKMEQYMERMEEWGDRVGERWLD